MKPKRVASILTLVAICGTCLLAQDREQKKEAASTRIVQGSVMDSDENYVNGAVVQLKDLRTLQVRSFNTQQKGEYHFSGLKLDDDYELKADYNGATSGWKKLSVFDSRKVPVINLKVEKK